MVILDDTQRSSKRTLGACPWQVKFFFVKNSLYLSFKYKKVIFQTVYYLLWSPTNMVWITDETAENLLKYHPVFKLTIITNKITNILTIYRGVCDEFSSVHSGTTVEWWMWQNVRLWRCLHRALYLHGKVWINTDVICSFVRFKHASDYLLTLIALWKEHQSP